MIMNFRIIILLCYLKSMLLFILSDEYTSDDELESSSSFGAWHFLTIFVVLGVAVVVGYLCVHNRKKV